MGIGNLQALKPWGLSDDELEQANRPSGTIDVTIQPRI